MKFVVQALRGSNIVFKQNNLRKFSHSFSTMTQVTEVSSNFSFGGYQKVFSHDSKELGCKMNFGIYLPPAAESKRVPVIYWLSGLTCTEQNFVQKAGAQKYASEHGVIIVAADTSPRGLNIPGEDAADDFGTGAGFYVDATEEPWKKNYRMYSYISSELPQVINANFPTLPDRRSIVGHSMGGHGALIIALKNPGVYRAVSAFAPISNPINGPWGIKALTGYLGADKQKWEDWDATKLAEKYNGPPIEIVIDQGADDKFYLNKQLLPENIVQASKNKPGNVSVTLRLREKYDHSYFFIASFIEDHIAYHAKKLSD